MNLIDLMTRNDKRLAVAGGARQIKFKVDMDVWRGIEFRENATEHLKITGLDRIQRMRSLPREIGWYARLRMIDNSSLPVIATQARGEIRLLKEGREIATHVFHFDSSTVSIAMPWEDRQQHLEPGSDLIVSFDIPAGHKVELLVHKALDRAKLLQLAVGNGVEVGPGPKPQVLESESTTVRYVEEMPIEKWKELYDTTGKYGTGTADFSKYIIGTADNVPAEKNSLDFIFSSHVFEHLANPLGHLVRWREILAPGGVILAVIPEMHSTKDLIATPSTIEEIEAEFLADIWKPSLAHYQRWLGFRGMRQSATEMMDKNSSIHVHFYDKTNLTALLETAVNEHGFSSYEIIHADNHKDFHFCLWK